MLILHNIAMKEEMSKIVLCMVMFLSCFILLLHFVLFCVMLIIVLIGDDSVYCFNCGSNINPNFGFCACCGARTEHMIAAQRSHQQSLGKIFGIIACVISGIAMMPLFLCFAYALFSYNPESDFAELGLYVGFFITFCITGSIGIPGFVFGLLSKIKCQIGYFPVIALICSCLPIASVFLGFLSLFTYSVLL